MVQMSSIFVSQKTMRLLGDPDPQNQWTNFFLQICERNSAQGTWSDNRKRLRNFLKKFNKYLYHNSKRKLLEPLQFIFTGLIAMAKECLGFFDKEKSILEVNM